MDDTEDRLIKEIRSMRSEMATIKEALDRGGYQGLTLMGGIQSLTKDKSKLDEIRRIVRNWAKDPTVLLSEIEKVLDIIS